MGHNPLPLSEIPIECVNIMRGQPEEFCFCKSEESGASPLYAEALEGYLYEPNASILKGGAYKSVAVRFALKKLHQNTHLYTSEFCLDNFPGRVFQVLACGGLGKSSVMSLLGSTDRANVAVRNFPLSVRELKKRLNLADGGEEYIYVTTLGPSSKHILVRMRRVGCHQFPNQCGSVAE